MQIICHKTDLVVIKFLSDKSDVKMQHNQLINTK